VGEVEDFLVIFYCFSPNHQNPFKKTITRYLLRS